MNANLTRARSAVERLQRLDMLDALGVAPCPWCRHPLVARLGRTGPYFHCGCPARPRRAAPAAGVLRRAA